MNPQSKSIEAFVRGTDGLFVLHDMSEDDAILFRSVEVKVPVGAVFQGAGPEGA